MRLFIDTNVLLDVLDQRLPHFRDSYDVVLRSAQLGADVYMAWHTLATVFYLMAKKHDRAHAEGMLRMTLSWATIAEVGHADALHALTLGMGDFEDALQVASARAEGVTCIVTRDTKDFSKSPIQIMSPAEFLTQHGRP